MEDLIIKKSTSGLGELLIKPVAKQLAKELTIKNHYSHKWNDGSFGVYNFGIFKADQPDDCLGVAVYGYMKNVKARIFEHPNPAAWMCELNRMWIADVLGKNAETVLISASIKLLRRINKNIVAVQSFADGRLGAGTIYKAANFQYYGYHWTKFVVNQRTEQILTNTTSATGYLRSNIAYIIGDLKTFQVKTYRYIYPLCKRFKFSKKPQPYPQYEKGMHPTEWNRDIVKVKQNIIALLDKVPYK
ncbi:hypothetical protein FW774_17365 [Pedobacter sp. BS3]|uniref:Mom family adenine methylcarbamoylation protein n=1 Tax=Pedobacter sp. BS3 TaxID=2567937 RepID=UPI0011EBC163|nr:hypothetical protein [Pedobacter sp. BS3]TZF81825.1 hypothetical protein FW774_17365 [Pedobacter sp. BS3]